MTVRTYKNGRRLQAVHHTQRTKVKDVGMFMQNPKCTAGFVGGQPFLYISGRQLTATDLREAADLLDQWAAENGEEVT